MNTRDLVEAISSDSGLTKVQADRALNSLAANLTIALKKNEDVYIAGIGTFTTARLNSSDNNDDASSDSATGSGEATRIPKFTPGTELLTAVR